MARRKTRTRTRTITISNLPEDKLEQHRFTIFNTALGKLNVETIYQQLAKILKKKNAIYGGAGEMETFIGELSPELRSNLRNFTQSYDDNYTSYQGFSNKLEQIVHNLNVNCGVRPSSIRPLLQGLGQEHLMLLDFFSTVPDRGIRQRLAIYINRLVTMETSNARAQLRHDRPIFYVLYGFMRIGTYLCTLAGGIAKWGSLLLALYIGATLAISSVYDPSDIPTVVAESGHLASSIFYTEQGELTSVSLLMGMLSCMLVHLVSFMYLYASLHGEIFAGLERRQLVNRQRVVMKSLLMMGWAGWLYYDWLAVSGQSLEIFNTLLASPTSTLEMQLLRSQLSSQVIGMLTSTWNYLFIGVVGRSVEIIERVVETINPVAIQGSEIVRTPQQAVKGWGEWMGDMVYDLVYTPNNANANSAIAIPQTIERTRTRYEFQINTTNPYSMLNLIDLVTDYARIFVNSTLQRINMNFEYKFGKTQINNWVNRISLALFSTILYNFHRVIGIPIRVLKEILRRPVSQADERINQVLMTALRNQLDEYRRHLDALDNIGTGVEPAPFHSAEPASILRGLSSTPITDWMPRRPETRSRNSSELVFLADIPRSRSRSRSRSRTERTQSATQAEEPLYQLGQRTRSAHFYGDQ